MTGLYQQMQHYVTRININTHNIGRQIKFSPVVVKPGRVAGNNDVMRLLCDIILMDVWSSAAILLLSVGDGVRSFLRLPKLQNTIYSTVKAPVFGTLNSAISNFQTGFVRTVMKVLKYCWM